MLSFTKEGKNSVLDILKEASTVGKYSEKFRDELLKKLACMHLMENGITLHEGELKMHKDYENRTVKFSCEFPVSWDQGTHGGLVWNEFSQSFGLHS